MDGGAPEQLTSWPGADSFPSWTPEGDIIFGHRDGTNTHLYIMSAASNWAADPLTFGSGTQGFPVVSPNGGRIAFQWDRDGNDAIFTMARDGTDIQRITQAPANDRYPAWSPDGRWLAFHANRHDEQSYDIYIVSVTSDGRSADGPVGRLTTDPLFDDEPAWHR